MARQTAHSAGCDLVRRFRWSSPTMFDEDAANALGATYASVRITPLNPLQRERSHIFRVGFCMTNDFVRPVSWPVANLPRKGGGRMLINTGAHWLRLIVGSAGGMSRTVRWPRKKPDQNK